ncbi:MAG: PspA/IM30 family protein [Candidatus Riflebacteria bacterium]|nr:PspA/IM30 family protein [Candidatus Riflebacteria bacterium]
MFKRLMSWIRGFFGLFIKGLEQDKPEYLIEAQKENLRNQVQKYNENLANAAAFVERLKRVTKADQQKEQELSAKIKANLSVGNNQVAGQLALQYKELKARMTENAQQLEMAENNYTKLERTRDTAIREAENKLMKLQNKLSEAQMYEAQASLQEMAKGMTNSIGNDMNFDHVTEAIEERRDKALGRARVAGGGLLEDNSGLVKQAEMDALGNAALAEFMAMNDSGAAQSTPILPESVEVVPDGQQRNMGPMMRE